MEDNKEFNKLLGKRDTSKTPFDFPDSLGYACPICGSSDEVNLEWSEYESCIWCNKCKIDIPSCMCHKYHQFGRKKLSKKEKIKKDIKIFIETIKYVKKGK